jgi:hypothetical protein
MASRILIIERNAGDQEIQKKQRGMELYCPMYCLRFLLLPAYRQETGFSDKCFFCDTNLVSL